MVKPAERRGSTLPHCCVPACGTWGPPCSARRRPVPHGRLLGRECSGGVTISVPGRLARTDRPGCQSAYPDSAGQEQGGVERSVHTRAVARVVAGPGGPSGQASLRYVIVTVRTYREQ